MITRFKDLSIALKVVLFIALVIFSQPGNAQATGSAMPGPVNPAPAQTKPGDLSPPPPASMKASAIVTDVYNIAHSDSKDANRGTAGLGDQIIVHVQNIKDLLDRATAQKKEVKLFLDGHQIDDIKPVSGAPDKDDGDFQFTLQRTAVNDKVWTDILGKPGTGQFFLRPVKISVGVDGSYAEHSTVDGFSLVRIRETWFYGCLIGLVVYLGALTYLTFTTNMLRDAAIDLSVIGVNPPAKSPFSLGKVQMAFWFSLMLAAFLFIWLITGNYDIISTGVLGLIGISATTALGAVVIGDTKTQTSIQDIVELIKQENDLQTAIAVLPAGDPTISAKSVQVTQIQATIAKKKAGLNFESEGMLNDLLTDASGISFHRLQMFIWTLVLGMIFLYSAWASLIMPDFSATLLTLQGITAGTYLGFKFPEKQS